MDNQTIISKMNGYLHEGTVLLLAWLENILPRVSDSWWDDCVLSSLSIAQKEMARDKGYSKLSDFDLAALLRIANKSWYDMRTVIFLPNSERETIRGMIGVRNNWAHISAELPGKDTIIEDLRITSSLLSQLHGSKTLLRDIDNFIKCIEQPDSIQTRFSVSNQALLKQPHEMAGKSNVGGIREKTLVYLTGSPDVRGIVFSVTDIGDIKKYEVFVDGSLRTYYSGQIAPVEEIKGYNWVSLDTFRSSLTAYQINNPSSQNLYSLNSARIDFVPYQFRPALKMIHADEPRILIADSVGVGKTIEAGLIIKELEARNELEKVVVICPRPLVSERKWEIEMKRFDEDFTPVDGQTLRQIISDTDRDGEWPVRFNKVIIPYSIMDSRTYYGDDDKRVHSFGLAELDPEPHFDLVIVDEAHHIRNGSMEKEKAFAYKCTRYFCDHADAVVMLTATPLQTGDTDLFTLLNVLRPDVIIDQKTFEMMSKPNAFISKAVHSVRQAETGWQKKALNELLSVRRTQWGDNVIAENPLYDDVLERLNKEEHTREERVKLISDIESLHSFSTMINRTRRRDIQDFCVRRSHTVSTEFTEAQRELHDELLSFEKKALSALHDVRAVPFMMSMVKRQAASCIFGLAPHIKDMVFRRLRQVNDEYDFEGSDNELDEDAAAKIEGLAARILQLAENLPSEDPKFKKILEIVHQKNEFQNNKIMIFSTFRHTLAYLKRKLSEEGYRVAQIDGSVKDEDRYRLKELFALPKNDMNAVDILLFTEVGSEGLDYQFCDTMINYDLPWNPMKIEQRIGRIDRRGQQNESVQIYNVITEGTVDADIYYRCLSRIGIFESHIGDCEVILGAIASEIESTVLNSKLTEEERREKLEQIADNEVLKAQELAHLEKEEKELFGFDLTEFTTSQEIRRAENPWLTQEGLQHLVEHYLKEKVGNGVFLLGDGPLKTIRLSASARGIVRDDLKQLPGSRNMVLKKWDSFLSGKNPTHSLTFDPDTAAKEPDSFFITAMHPLARQAAAYYSQDSVNFLRLDYYTDTVPPGMYPFSVYAWKYCGINNYTSLVTICSNERIADALPDILDSAKDSDYEVKKDIEWDGLESRQVKMWLDAREKHRRDAMAAANFKLESLSNNQRNKIRSLEQQIKDTPDDSIRRMHMSELETVRKNFGRKAEKINETAKQADIYTDLLAKGIVIVKEG